MREHAPRGIPGVLVVMTAHRRRLLIEEDRALRHMLAEREKRPSSAYEVAKALETVAADPSLPEAARPVASEPKPTGLLGSRFVTTLVALARARWRLEVAVAAMPTLEAPAVDREAAELAALARGGAVPALWSWSIQPLGLWHNCSNWRARRSPI